MAPYPLRILPHLPPPHEMYRAYLRNLRYIPDPHVWAQLAPRYRRLMGALRKPLPPIPAKYAASLPDMGVAGRQVMEGLEMEVEKVQGAKVEEKVQGAKVEEKVGEKLKEEEKLEEEERDMREREAEQDAEGSPFETSGKTETEKDGKKDAKEEKEKTDDELWEDYTRAREQRYRDIRRAKTDLNQLRQAVAVHPHTLVRLLKMAYGQKGKIRWELIKNITETSQTPAASWKLAPPKPPQYPPRLFQPLPLVLRVLTPPYIPRSQPERLKPVPACRVLKQRKLQWQWEWANARVPLSIPPNSHGTATGWEKLKLEETLRIIAGLTNEPVGGDIPKRLRKAGEKEIATPEQPSILNPRSLPTYAFLRPSLQRLFPKRLRTQSPPDAYPKPPPRLIRLNSRLWGEPGRMDARMLRRVYMRFYTELPRVRVKEEVPNPDYVEPEAADDTETEKKKGRKGKKKKEPYPEPRTLIQWIPNKHVPKEDVIAAITSRFRKATDEEMEWWRKNETPRNRLLLMRNTAQAGERERGEGEW